MSEEKRRRGVALRKARRVLLGCEGHAGLLVSLARYLLLTVIAFVFVYPMLNMVVLSLSSSKDLMDVTVKWWPSELTTLHFQHAAMALNYKNNLLMTTLLVLVCAVLQTFISSLVGYGFARFSFPGKKLLMGLMLLSYLLPSQATALANYVLFQELSLTDGTIKPFVITCLLGQGMNSGLCILIFYSFHRQAPRSLLEAAEIDGAGALRTYASIALPMVSAGVIIVAVFTVIWYWNDLYTVETYIGYRNLTQANEQSLTTLMIQLARFGAAYEIRANNAIDSPDKLNAAKKMAAVMLTILPLLAMYAVVQRRFVRSIDNSGLTGE